MLSWSWQKLKWLKRKIFKGVNLTVVDTQVPWAEQMLMVVMIAIFIQVRAQACACASFHHVCSQLSAALSLLHNAFAPSIPSHRQYPQWATSGLKVFACRTLDTGLDDTYGLAHTQTSTWSYGADN